MALGCSTVYTYSPPVVALTCLPVGISAYITANSCILYSLGLYNVNSQLITCLLILFDCIVWSSVPDVFQHIT